MADVNRGDRPLSPHLQVYRLPLTAVMSILHRITGTAMLVSIALVTWWLLAAASGDEATFKFADGFLSGYIGGFIMLCSLFGLCYHALNGVRHLLWDAGYGFELKSAAASNIVVLLGAVGLTALGWLAWIAI
ncbi:MAG: succinate dehydrogenase, cytochrome b556 subunit [Neomegalonema sp.]|nr:succinate dehydrogenase, cytochrome b556 subunit [Neomegalonema sp.]